jgi:hypothetical protein
MKQTEKKDKQIKDSGKRQGNIFFQYYYNILKNMNISEKTFRKINDAILYDEITPHIENQIIGIASRIDFEFDCDDSLWNDSHSCAKSDTLRLWLAMMPHLIFNS